MAEQDPSLPTTPRQPVQRRAFLEKVRRSTAVASSSPREVLAKALAPSGRPRLLFAMDATASREPAWNIAKEITGAMFAAVPGALDVALAYHGGGRLRLPPMRGRSCRSSTRSGARPAARRSTPSSTRPPPWHG
jgi:hypothetical protein